MAVALEFSLVSLTPFLFPPAKAFSVLLAFLDDGSGEDAVADESANADTDAASALQNSLKTICNLHSLTPFFFYRLPQVVTVGGRACDVCRLETKSEIPHKNTPPLNGADLSGTSPHPFMLDRMCDCRACVRMFVPFPTLHVPSSSCHSIFKSIASFVLNIVVTS